MTTHGSRSGGAVCRTCPSAALRDPSVAWPSVSSSSCVCCFHSSVEEVSVTQQVSSFPRHDVYASSQSQASPLSSTNVFSSEEPARNRVGAGISPLPVGTQTFLVASWLERGHACLQLSLPRSLLYLLCQTKACDLVGGDRLSMYISSFLTPPSSPARPCFLIEQLAVNSCNDTEERAAWS